MALEGNIIAIIVICSLLLSSYIGFQIFNAVTLFRAARRSRQGYDPELANNSNPSDTTSTTPPQTTELEKLPPDHLFEVNTSFLNPRPPPIPSVRLATTAATPYFTTQNSTTWSPLTTDATNSTRHPISAQDPSSHDGRPCTNSCYADPFDLEELVSTPQFLPHGAYSPPGLFASPPRAPTRRLESRERRLTAMTAADVRPHPAASGSDGGSVSPIAPDDAFSIGSDYGSDCGDEEVYAVSPSGSDGSTGVIPCKFSGVSDEISPPPAGLEEEDDGDDDRAISGLQNVELELGWDGRDVA